MSRFRILNVFMGLAACVVGCIDVHRGAILYLNLTTIPLSAEGQHYQLFGVVNEGVVSLGRFKVLRAVDDCGADPDLVPNLTLVQRYDNGASASEVCAFSRRLGARDEVNLAAGVLVGGVRIDTPVDLRDAEAVFITAEPDGDGDPRPEAPVMRADLAAGRSPHEEAARACLVAFCETAPENPVCASIQPLSRARRGVILGTFLQTPVTDACNAVVAGEVAIVPAEDDTF